MKYGCDRLSHACHVQIIHAIARIFRACVLALVCVHPTPSESVVNHANSHIRWFHICSAAKVGSVSCGKSITQLMLLVSFGSGFGVGDVSTRVSVHTHFASLAAR